MKRKLRLKTGSALVLSFAILMSGCSNTSSDKSPAKSNVSASNGPVDTSPFGKYKTPIELTTAKAVGPNDKYPEGDSAENNIYTRFYKDELGINVKTVWTALSGEQYDQKMKLTVASGDLPDLMAVNAQQLAQLVENDQIADLTDAVNKYSSDLTKHLLHDDDGIALKSATFKGKIMAIPSQNSALDTSNVLWIRKDWLDKLGFQPPKTMSDVKKIAEAFTKQDPDGNGKADTYGLGFAKTLWSGSPNLEGFFNGYHAYPTIWVKNASDKLTYGAVQPESKKALADLQKMYKEGLIDPEFGVKDSNQVNQDINANKIGMFYGKMYSPFMFMTTASQNPSIQWQSYPLPSVDSAPAFTQQDFPIQYYYVVRKGFEHPEAAVKLLNLHQEVSLAGADSEIHTRLYPQLLDKDPEIQSTQLIGSPIIIGGPALKNLNQYLHINQAIEQKDESLLIDDEERKNYKQVVAYMTSKDPAGYGTWAIVGPTSPFKILNDYFNNKQYVVNGFYGAATPTMTRNKATLDKLILEEYTKIIVGNASVDQFDKVVQDWNNLGGKQITKEVREWESSR